MAPYKLLKKGNALFLIGLMEVALPFVRMLILSRMLQLSELGFASALASTYAMFEMVTDIAVFRFVYTQPREQFEEIMAAAHALSVLRGVVVALLAFALSPLIASAFSLQADWQAFGALSAIIFIKSFEHVEPKVAERDYNYGPQMKLLWCANVLSFICLLVALQVYHDHRTFTASLLGLNFGIALFSHVFSKTPYRLAFRSPYFVRCFRFGYPLMLNGAGLALSSQGDRFLVGAFLGLPELGVYSVVMLAVIVPIGMVFRLTGTVISAALYNAGETAERALNRLQLISRASPMIAILYATGVIFLANIVIPLAFGAQFHISRVALCLLAFGAFLRIARGDPFTALLILARRTKRIAVSNFAVIFALLFAFVIIYMFRSIEAALMGRLLGEAVGLAVILFMSRKLMAGANGDYFLSFSVAFLLLVAACALVLLTPAGQELAPSLLALAVFLCVYAVWGWIILRPSILREMSFAAAAKNLQGKTGGKPE